MSPVVKSRRSTSDSVCMMISDEQVRHALALLRERPDDGESHAADVPSTVRCTIDPVVIAHAAAIAASAPDMRPDRIEHARALLRRHPPTSEEVAVRMLSRMLVDSLR